jgi:CHAT domain-containing protein/tetratricopeptide (TPR) repeat protein
MRRRAALGILLAYASAFVDCRARPSSSTAGGVVIESVAAGSAGYAAELREGDELLGWRVSDCSAAAQARATTGTLSSAFELSELERERAPVCHVELEVRRTAAVTAATLGGGTWDITVRPPLAGPPLALYETARRAAKEATPDEASSAWTALADALTTAGRPRDACWALTRKAMAAATAKRWPEAERAFESARALTRAGGHAEDEAPIWLMEANARYRQEAFESADTAFSKAIALWERTAPDSLSLALALHTRGNVATFAGDPERAEPLLQRGLALREKLAPDSLATAQSLKVTGVVTMNRGDLDGAERMLTSGLELAQRQGEAGLKDVGQLLSYLAGLARRRGDLVRAEQMQKRSLEILRRVRPQSLDVAISVMNLAFIYVQRGDFEAAENCNRESLSIAEKVPQGGLIAAQNLESLGYRASERGDAASAEALLKKSLARFEELAPGSAYVARVLRALGPILRRNGRRAESDLFFKRSLEASRKAAPGSAATAECLSNLASLAAERGQRREAERLLLLALAIDKSFAIAAAENLEDLGNLALAAGDLAQAEARHRQALDLRMRMMPGSAPLARSWHALALIQRKQSRPREAMLAMENALTAIEAQQDRIGGAQDVRSHFAAGFADFYHDAVALLVEQRQPRAALHVVERSRARGLLALLAERDLVFADAPADLTRARAQVDAAYDSTQAQISAIVPAQDGPAIEGHLARLRELRDQRAHVESQLRAASPRLASLRHPDPLELDGVRAVLDPGTLLLQYSVGSDKTFLFIVQPQGEGTGTGLTVLTLPIGDAALRTRIATLRGAIERGRETLTPEPILLAQSARLFDDLVKPAQPWIASARRLLISPDGPLHLLPFAALVSSQTPLRYLIEDKPVHITLSATLYAELRKTRSAQRVTAPTLVAFGDPVVTSGSPVGAPRPSDGAALRAGRTAPLPWSRLEVDGIAGLFGAGAIKYLGEDATEERARSVGTGARYVHFATHGLLDRRLPLNSALVLSTPPAQAQGRENGLLQAWEIFESVRLDAELVTLSACETGIGPEAGGEGLVSLSRAFQFAGARSVSASLWSVSDRSTSRLMTRLYAGLKSGLSKDEALRTAQLELLHDPGTAHPFHWAGFQLSGDWK